MTNKEWLESLSDKELADFIGRVGVQLEPGLTQQFLSVAEELVSYRTKLMSGQLVELPFTVIDKQTQQEADPYEIALKEDWAKGLCYCDMEGFAITHDGSLILLDECGEFVYCPCDRFEIIAEARLKELKEKK